MDPSVGRLIMMVLHFEALHTHLIQDRGHPEVLVGRHLYLEEEAVGDQRMTRLLVDQLLHPGLVIMMNVGGNRILDLEQHLDGTRDGHLQFLDTTTLVAMDGVVMHFHISRQVLPLLAA